MQRAFVPLACLAVLALGVPAHAQIPPPKRPLVATTPPPAGVSPFTWYYPEHAQRMGIEGKAVINCEVDVEGRFQDCRLVSETPEGEAFGEASLAVAGYFKIKPKRDEAGHPVPGGRLDVPLAWSLEPDDAAQPKKK